MRTHPQEFGQLFTQAVRVIAAREDKPIAVVHDELGYALGKDGGSAIEYWRKGHVPAEAHDLENVIRELARRGGLDRADGERLLRSAGYAGDARMLDNVFPPISPTPGQKGSLSELSPFVAGPPMTVPRQFFGRERELRRIFGLWSRYPLQHVALVGPRRSGKTSLLHYLKNITRAAPSELRPGQRTDWLPQPERYRWALVDFQDGRMTRRDRLLRYLLASLNLPTPEPCDLDRFMDVVGEHLQGPAIILMDEIEAALAAPELDGIFWGSLRALVNVQAGGHLAFALAAHTDPLRLAHPLGKPSPFFNIFHILELGPLTAPETRELIGSSPKPFTPGDAEWIVEQSGQWPCLIQILCQARLAALEDDQVGDAWRAEGQSQMAPFRYLLSGDKTAHKD